MNDISTYKNQDDLRAAGAVSSYTQDQVQEFLKCAMDPKYFIENYVKIIDADGTEMLFKLRPYQEKFLDLMIQHRFVIGKMARQSGKSAIVSAYLLHCALFNDNFNILIAANRSKTAKEIMGKVKVAFRGLPLWLQKGVISFNEHSVKFENGSKIAAEATTENSGRGGTNQIVMLDEFAFVKPNVADEFLSAVYPTIAGGTRTKLFIISTPNGMNHYHDMWVDAEEGRSNFKHIAIEWDDPPGRDETYRSTTIANVGIEKWMQEYECQFLGQSASLIKMQTLHELRQKVQDPLETIEGSLRIFKKPEANRAYFITADTGHGKDLDYSAFIVFDITKHPYEIVAVYQDNEVSHLLYPNKIYEVAKAYNDATVLCEVNDLGESVAHLLYYDLEYENMLMTSSTPEGIEIGHSGKHLGLNVRQGTRRIGCSAMKALIEGRQLLIPDVLIVKELSNFVLHKQKYQAAPGKHDDMVMCMVLFAWAINQQYFKDVTDSDIRETLFADQMKQIEEDLIPFGIMDDVAEEDVIEEGGWQKVTNHKLWI